MRGFLWAFLMAAGVAVASAQAPAPGGDGSPFGAQTVWPDQSTLPVMRQAQADAGIKWGRFDLCWWSICESTPGVYNFNPGNWKTDAAIDAMRAEGIEPFPILCYGNAPMYDHTTEAGRVAFGNYCYAAATRYKDKVRFWEVWNEPNLPFFWGATPNGASYAALAIEAAARIREGNPNAVVVGGSISTMDFPFITAAFQAGLLNAIDVVSVHPYRVNSPESVNTDYATLRSLIDQYKPAGKDIRIWSSEWGYNTCWTEVSEEGQAKMLSRMMINNFAQGIDLSIWFSTHPFAENSNCPTDPQWGLLNYDNSHRPSWLAMKVLNDRFPPPVAHVSDPFSTSVSPTRSNMRWEFFTTGGGANTTMAIWRAAWPVNSTYTGTNVTITMNIGAGRVVTAYDGMSGDPAAISTSPSGANTIITGVTARDYPTYIVVGPPPEPLDAEVVSTSFPSLVEKDSTFPVSVTYKNLGSATWGANTRLAASSPRDRASAFYNAADWISTSRATAPDAFSVAPGAEGTFTFTAKAPSAAGTHHESFELVEEGTGWFEGTGDDVTWDVEVVDALPNDAAELLSMDLPTALDAGRVYIGSISYRNIGAQSWDSTVRLGTSDPRDRTSPLRAYSWLSNTRLAPATNTPVATGGTGTFSFDLIAPMQSANLAEHYELVRDSLSTNWFAGTGDDATWNVQVTRDPMTLWLEAELYDVGGEGVGYHDADPTNNGNNPDWYGRFRTDGVDLGITGEGDYFVGWLEVGEWLKFSNKAAIPGEYKLEARIASLATGGQFHVDINGANATGTVTFPATGDWQTWSTIDCGNVQLTNNNTIVLHMDSASWNVSWLRLTLVNPSAIPDSFMLY